MDRLLTLDAPTMKRAPLLNLTRIGLCTLLLVLPDSTFSLSETNAVSDASAEAFDASVSNETLRAYLQLQGQLHETQQAIERTRQQAEEAAARHEAVMKNTDSLAGQLREVKETLTTQQARDARFTIIVVSAFAGVCFLAVIMTSFFQWRTVNRLAQWSGPMPLNRSFAAPGAVSALGAGEDPTMVPAMNIDTPNVRLLGAIERLEKRILELEQAARPPLADASGETNGDPSNGGAHLASAPDAGPQDGSERLKELLETGQSLLNDDRAEAAIECLDQALALDPRNSEALVKKGAALEKLRKLPEAIECYDRAIAADSSLTIAYLYKGGLYNRMERFSEAVECYEKALRTQEKKSTG